MSAYSPCECIELAAERYEPETMSPEEHREFLHALFQLAEQVKADLDLDEDDVQDFLAQPEEFEFEFDEDEEDGDEEDEEADED